MFWIALAAAAQISTPVPQNLRHWFSNEDVPVFLLQQNSGFWTVGIRIDVASDGKVRSCGIETSGGIPDLDALTCQIVRQRAKFRSAHWIDGSPTLGVYRTSVNWAVSVVPTDWTEVSNPVLDLSVDHLPSGAKSPTLVRVMFAVDPLSGISSCAAEPGDNFERAENIIALVPIACQELIKSYRPVPPKDRDGRSVSSVQDAVVRFSAGPGK
jgi:hypothetical protein